MTSLQPRVQLNASWYQRCLSRKWNGGQHLACCNLFLFHWVCHRHSTLSNNHFQSLRCKQYSDNVVHSVILCNDRLETWIDSNNHMQQISCITNRVASLISIDHANTNRAFRLLHQKTILEHTQNMTCTSKHRLSMFIQSTYTFWDKRVSQDSRKTYCQSHGAPSTWHAVWAFHSDLLNRANVEHVLPKKPNQELCCASRVLQQIKHQHRSNGRASQAAISFKRFDCGRHCEL